jgi:hypothetical protein
MNEPKNSSHAEERRLNALGIKKWDGWFSEERAQAQRLRLTEKARTPYGYEPTWAPASKARPIY